MVVLLVVDLTVVVVVVVVGFRVGLVSTGCEFDVTIKSSADNVGVSIFTICSAGVGRGRGNSVVVVGGAADVVAIL